MILIIFLLLIINNKYNIKISFTKKCCHFGSYQSSHKLFLVKKLFRREALLKGSILAYIGSIEQSIISIELLASYGIITGYNSSFGGISE